MFQDFFGRFHPLLVHLPIGIFLFGVFFKIYLKIKKSKEEHEIAFDLIKKASFFVSLFAAITGYILSLSGEYAPETITFHQYSGIAFTLILGVFAFVKIKNNKIENVLWLGLSVLLSVVGHLGGSLTHGEDYLTLNSKKEAQKLEIADVQKAKAYAELVQPILESKCYGCHAAEKQKGKLRMDSPAAMLKGGKNGPCFVAGDVNKSNLIKRMLLPIGDEEHMPPKGKPQLSDNEREVLKWWIAGNASFEKNVSQIPQNEPMKMVLASFQSQNKQAALQNELPKDDGPDYDTNTLETLKTSGIVCLPIAAESNYLALNILNKNVSEADWVLIDRIAPNILFFKSNGAVISNSGLKTISKMNNLRALHLNKAKIEKANLAALGGLKLLRVLNITGVNLKLEEIRFLGNLKNLEKLYVFETGLKPSELLFLQKNSPKIKIDTGGYQVPTFQTDTTYHAF